MRILFCSNYFTHHQVSLSDALYELTNHNYCFVAHKEMDAERKNLGWGNDLVRSYTCSASDQEVQKQLNDLDVLIAGSFPERQTKEYGKKAKLFFRYSERPLKAGNPVLKYTAISQVALLQSTLAEDIYALRQCLYRGGLCKIRSFP